MKTVFSQKAIFFFAVILFASGVFAQDKTLVGKVTTFDSIPLIGVDVLVKSTKLSYKTDSLGRFQVFCNAEDRLEISAGGFYSQKVKVEKGTRMIFINLKLKKGDNNLDMAGRYVNVVVTFFQFKVNKYHSCSLFNFYFLRIKP
ncbi:MAG TPA: carboxypeptidase-like regulatory domain-containing protein, partial [Draconibacterium sp.]|nr:carboxypeptidase-like regulatory domain-containing protein [Draconibacterium sp.]